MSSKVLELSSVRFPQVVTQEKPLYEKVKRSFDLCMSLCALIVLWPLFLLIAVLVYSEDKGPAIYKHKPNRQRWPGNLPVQIPHHEKQLPAD